jgi:hypothetical protein
MANIRPIAVDMSNGDITHHHDQSIYFVSFSTMKAIVRSPQKPIPLLLEFSLLIL